MTTSAALPRARTLDGLDASFLYAESANMLMHTLKVAVLEPGSATLLRSRADWVLLRRRVAEVADRLPPLRRRLVSVPLQLHHPRWIEVRGFDSARHVEHVSLRRRLGHARDRDEDAAVDAVLAEFLVCPLARHRPLWSLLIITGLSRERLVVAVKLHHALADGQAAAALIQAITDETPRDWRPPEDRGEHLASAAPNCAMLLAQAIARRLADLGRLPALTVDALIRGVQAVELRQRARWAPPRLFAGPRTFFNRTLGPSRAARRLQLPLEVVTLVKRQFDVRFNDVLLAIVAGAFARMRRRGLLGGAPLLVSIPMAAERDEPDVRVQGNRVSTGFTSLCDHVEDARERLLAIHEITATAKQMADVRGLDQMRRWAEFDAPWWQQLAWTLTRVSRSPPVNLIVSNVAGPPRPRWLGPMRIDELWSFGPLVERVGLNVTAWSYADRLSVGVLADAGQWTSTQLDEFVADMREAAAELAALAGSRPGPSI